MDRPPGAGTADDCPIHDNPRPPGDGEGEPAPRSPRLAPTDALIDALAARQHGVVARRQLLEAGVAAHVLDYRVRTGRLRLLHRGVYRVGPLRAPLEREMAAVLAGGEAACLSGASAGVVWDILPGAARPPVVEISRRRGHRGRTPGIRVRLVRTLRDDEATTLHGVPITTPARTLLDLAGTLGTRALEQALARAERLELAAAGDVARVMKRHPGSPGVAVLRGLLALPEGPALTRSEAEERFLALVRGARLPGPAVNARVVRIEVDFLWRRERVIVEIDGFAYHRSRRAFERDRDRDRALRATGFRVLRFTWQQLTDERDAVLASVAQELARATPAHR